MPSKENFPSQSDEFRDQFPEAKSASDRGEEGDKWESRFMDSCAPTSWARV